MQGFVKEGYNLKIYHTRHNEFRRNSFETKVQPFSDDFNNICRIGPNNSNGSLT